MLLVQQLNIRAHIPPPLLVALGRKTPPRKNKSPQTASKKNSPPPQHKPQPRPTPFLASSCRPRRYNYSINETGKLDPFLIHFENPLEVLGALSGRSDHHPA